MYCSLRRVDIVTESPSGERVLVQTDHRAPAEIDEMPELSVLFALARVLLPQRVPEWAGAVVRYVALGGAHPLVAQAVAAAGGELHVEQTPFDLSEVARVDPGELADQAFAALSRRVLMREQLELGESALEELERRLAGTPEEDDDEVAYWTAVAELAAVTGEVMRERYGGRWIADAHGYADIPFMFRGADDDAQSNIVGKAVRFLAHGEAQSPRLLLRAFEDRGTPDGPLLFTLKPASWGLDNEMVWESLTTLAPPGTDVPVIVYGHDHPNTFAMFKHDRPRERAALREEALTNLAGVEVEVERVELETFSFWIAHGSYFAGEKILDVAFMQRMHEQLGPLIAASVPEKGRLFLMAASDDADALAGFVALTRGVHQRNEGGRQISPTVFLVAEGQIIGVAAPAPDDDGASNPSRLTN